MSALSVQISNHRRRLALVVAVVGALALSVILLVSATTGGTTSPPEPSPITADPRGGAVTDAGVNPWQANNPALVTP